MNSLTQTLVASCSLCVTFIVGCSEGGTPLMTEDVTSSGGGTELGSGGAPPSGGSGTMVSGDSGGATGPTGGAVGSGGEVAGTGGQPGATGGESGEEEDFGSEGCGEPRSLQDGDNTVQSGGSSRKYKLNVPSDYDNKKPYRLILGFHGATGKSGDVAPSYFGLWDLAEGSTIFIAPDGAGGFWNSDNDVVFVDDILAQVQAALCIDTSRIQLEGFSQGGAMAWTLACARPGVFSAAVVHSGGGLARPENCDPIPFLSSLGQSESGGAGQTSNSDFFAAQNGCTVAPLAKAPSGGHACSDYSECSPESPTRWCDYDGGHTPSPSDQGQNKSWMPQEVWSFLSQF